MFQASGDVGAYSGAVFAPSDNPFITIVGGTSLIVSNGAWYSESTWSSSGGGISTAFAIPIWQQGLNMSLNQGSTTMRNIPDVACLADSAVWLVANNGEQGFTGGTSVATPLWAGFTALVNQQAAISGKPAVGFLNPALYAIGGSPGASAAFHDITTGSAGMIGLTGKAETAIDPEGTIFVRGELWKARSKMSISRGESVTVTGMDGLTLDVEGAKDAVTITKTASAADE